MYTNSTTSSYTSLIGPAISSCPRRIYSQKNWFDYKSSYLQLSQKIIYRMNAQYHRLQAQDNREYEPYRHIQSCLLNTHCKKNPFKKTYAIQDGRGSRGLTLSQSFNNPHWTQQAAKNSFVLPQQSIHTATQTARAYGQVKQKLATVQPVHKSDRLISANSIFDKSAMKITFGQEKQKFIQSQTGGKSKLFRTETVETLGEKSQSRDNLKQTNYKTYRKNLEEAPSKINVEGKTYFFVKVGIQK